MENKSEELFAIEKNAGELLVIRDSTYRNHQLIDVRVSFRDKAGDYHPTRKGICLGLELWTQILPEITKAIQQMKQATTA